MLICQSTEMKSNFDSSTSEDNEFSRMPENLDNIRSNLKKKNKTS